MLLSNDKCIPCHGGEKPMDDDTIRQMLEQVDGWRLRTHNDIRKIEKTFEFSDFQKALDFTNAVGALAEEEGHHPVLVTEWGKVTVIYWTHATGGLHRNDFVMAAKTDERFRA
jgi:4a-hydroxytetrahydrobiopterin dehydratase